MVWAANPYAALLVIPALHVWLIPLAPELRVRRWLAVALVLAGAIPLALLAVGYLTTLRVNPLQGLWMALVLVAGGHVGPLAALIWSLMLGGGVAVLAASARRAQGEPAQPSEITVRGPVSYAGPGSLGGTRSALRR
jgi:small-conductance mechanosensitive channel